jgi:archaellum component FlaC
MSENNENTAAGTPKVPSSLERLQTVEKTLVGVTQALRFVDQELTTLKQHAQNSIRGVENVAELFTAHVKLMGEEYKTKLAAAVEEHREEIRKQKEEAARTMVKSLVEKGDLVLADTIDESSLVVFTEFDKENKEVGTHYTPVWVRELSADIIPRLTGQKAGADVEVEGGRLHALEVYRQAPSASVNPDTTTETVQVTGDTTNA